MKGPDSALATTPQPATVPGWARPRGPATDAAEAAFAAGAALHALDLLVRANPAWAGAWRQRLALTCAVNACRLAGRSETQAALRDAWLLRKAGDDPGPAGSILGAFRQLATQPPALDRDGLVGVVERLGLRWDEAFAGLPAAIADLVHAGPAAPFAAVEVMRRTVTAAPGAEPLAWWLGDLVLAAKLRWPRPVPLLMAQAFSPALRSGDGRGRRLRPGGEGPDREAFARALCLAVADGASEACRLAADLARRAQRLSAVTPKLRAKGAGEVVARLLDDDAVPGTLTTQNLSRFAARRLFERLQGFEAVRELSGRPTFRLYGL